MEACTQWTHSDVWSQLPTTPECLFKMGERQSEKKLWNCDRRAICNATRGIDVGRGVIRHRGVSDGSDGVCPLWRSHSARTEMFFADGWPSVDYHLSRLLWWNEGATRQRALQQHSATPLEASKMEYLRNCDSGLSSLARWWEDKILPGREYPPNCLDLWNPGKVGGNKSWES